MTKPTEKDWQTFFALAKAHGFSFENCRKLAKKKFQKELLDLDLSELTLVALKIHYRRKPAA